MRHRADRPREPTSLSMKGRPPPDAAGGARKGGWNMRVIVDAFDLIAYGMIAILLIGAFVIGMKMDRKKRK